MTNIDKLLGTFGLDVELSTGEIITVKPARINQLSTLTTLGSIVFNLITPAKKSAQADPNMIDGQELQSELGDLLADKIIPIMTANTDQILPAVHNLSGYAGTYEEFGDIPLVDLIPIFMAIIQVNIDFFAQRLEPTKAALDAMLKNLKETITDAVSKVQNQAAGGR